MSFKVVSGIGGADNIKAELATVDAEVVLAPVWTEEDIIKSAADADAVMVGATEPYTRKVIEAMKKCRVISRCHCNGRQFRRGLRPRPGFSAGVLPEDYTHRPAGKAGYLATAPPGDIRSQGADCSPQPADGRRCRSG